MGSPGRAKSRHNKREQRGPAEKLAGGDRGEGTRPGQAPAQVAGGAPATRPGLPARSRRWPGRFAPPAAALSFPAAATGSPSLESPEIALVPSPGGSPSRPLLRVFIKLTPPGALGRGRRQRQPGGAPRSKQSNR